MAMLNSEQLKVFSIVSSGHNAVVTGQAGTGKSYMMKYIYENMKDATSIQVLSSTGISAHHFHLHGIQATTIHR